jgi:HD-GYP domain-containing protein (c-di-GMP phosphodiesterase class II)
VTKQTRVERVPGPLPYPLRHAITRDNEQDADQAARSIARYVTYERAHLIALWRTRDDERRRHARAVQQLRRAIAGELEEITP